jgi:hypothetical protein
MYVALICNDMQLSTVVLRSLNANGIRPLLICNGLCYAAFRASRGAKEVIKAGDAVTEAATVAEIIRQCDAVDRIDQILAADIVGLRLLDDIRIEVIPPIYPMPHRVLLEMLNDNTRFHQLLTNFGLAAPISRAYRDLRSVNLGEVSQQVGFPLIVKPVSANPSMEPRIVSDKAELFEVCSTQPYSPGAVIVEQLIEGTDVGVSAFARNGDPVAISTFFCGPKDITDFVEIPALAAIARKIVRKTAYNGIVNFEARIDRTGKLWILGCSPRFFARLTANRLCGLDLLSLGLPGAGSASSAPTGCYYPPAYVKRGEALRRLVAGEWPVRVLARSTAEILRDPGLLLMRGIAWANITFQKVERCVDNNDRGILPQNAQ